MQFLAGPGAKWCFVVGGVCILAGICLSLMSAVVFNSVVGFVGGLVLGVLGVLIIFAPHYALTGTPLF